MKKSKRVLGVIAAGLIGAGSLFSAVAVTGTLQQTETEAATTAVKKGWSKENGRFKYYGSDGKAYTGWHKMGAKEGEKTEHWSYFGGDGYLRTGWQSMGKGTKNSYGENTAKHMSYFGGDGWLRTGWQSMGKGTKNSYNENASKHMSYFGGDGWLRTGWQRMGQGNNTYGENNLEHWSYFGPNGWLRTDWQKMGTANNPDGKNAVHMSYFGSNGWLRTGMVDMGRGTINPDGNSEKHLSYFGNDGWLVVNKKFTYNKKPYIADGRGWATIVGHTHTWKYVPARVAPWYIDRCLTCGKEVASLDNDGSLDLIKQHFKESPECSGKYEDIDTTKVIMDAYYYCTDCHEVKPE